MLAEMVRRKGQETPRIVDRDFPFQVEVPYPPGSGGGYGLGVDLARIEHVAEMVARGRLAEADQPPVRTFRGNGEGGGRAPVRFRNGIRGGRWCFTGAYEAEEFRKRCGGELLPPQTWQSG